MSSLTNDNFFQEMLSDDDEIRRLRIDFSVLKRITNNFKDDNLIGEGGFGRVYKGILRNGTVAVKKLKVKLYCDIDDLEKTFEKEILCLTKANKHKNIVRLLGYCPHMEYELTATHEGKNVLAHEVQRLLCFEYLSNGSIDKYLSEASCGLKWRVRFQIIQGICEGLGYLHQHCRIIHMDLKPQNILLDDMMVPKITDFGISRLLPENQSMTNTETKIGTRGYSASEFLDRGIITFQTDIYSLGAIIAEILTAHRGCPDIHSVLESWTSMFGISERQTLRKQVRVCAEIAINCMDVTPGNRPSIQDVIRRLDETDISKPCRRSAASTSSVEQLADEMRSMTLSAARSQRKQLSLGALNQQHRQAKKERKAMQASPPRVPGETATKFQITSWFPWSKMKVKNTQRCFETIVSKNYGFKQTRSIHNEHQKVTEIYHKSIGPHQIIINDAGVKVSSVMDPAAVIKKMDKASKPGGVASQAPKVHLGGDGKGQQHPKDAGSEFDDEFNNDDVHDQGGGVPSKAEMVQAARNPMAQQQYMAIQQQEPKPEQQQQRMMMNGHDGAGYPPMMYYPMHDNMFSDENPNSCSVM